MTDPKPADVYSIEVRYTLDVMGYLLRRKQPRSVRICSDEPEMVKAIVRRLALDGYDLYVNSEELRDLVAETLGTRVAVRTDVPTDALFCPDLRHPAPTAERLLVCATRNALSYRSVRYPGSIRRTAMGVVGAIRHRFRVEQIVGLYPPRFVALLTAAQLAGLVNAESYFRLADHAMRDLFTFGPTWRLSYIVVLVAER